MWGDNECEPNVTDFVIRPVWYPTIQNTIPNTLPYQIPCAEYHTIPNTILYPTKYPSPIHPRFHPTGSSIVQTLGKRFEGIRLPAGAWLLQRSLDLFGHGVITVDCPLIFGEVTIAGNYRGTDCCWWMERSNITSAGICLAWLRGVWLQRCARLWLRG